MSKLIIYILCFLCFRCKQKTASTLSLKEVVDTTYFKQKSIKQDNGIKYNTVFDSSKVKKLYEDDSSKAFMQFSNNLDDNLDLFLEKMLLIDDSLYNIKYYNNTAELYFIQGDSVNFYKNITGDSSYWVFNHYMYHDIYNSLFTFHEINSIKIFVKNNIIDQSNPAYNTTPSIDDNVTLIPLSGDYEILLPNKTMERKWYIKNTNYWDIFSDNILDTSESYINKDFKELRAEIMDSIIEKYKSLE